MAGRGDLGGANCIPQSLAEKHAKLYVTDVIFLLVSSMSLVIPYGPMCLDSWVVKLGPSSSFKKLQVWK